MTRSGIARERTSAAQAAVGVAAFGPAEAGPFQSGIGFEGPENDRSFGTTTGRGVVASRTWWQRPGDALLDSRRDAGATWLRVQNFAPENLPGSPA
jgi:hypothetical protein